MEKDEEVNGQGGKRGAPAPHGGAMERKGWEGVPHRISTGFTSLHNIYIPIKCNRLVD